MLLFQNRMHMQRAILLVLLNGSAAANASVNNLPSIILLVRKIVLRGVNEHTESEDHFPPQSATLGNKLHSTSSKNVVRSLTAHSASSWRCAITPHTPSHYTHITHAWRHPRVCSFPLTGSAADQCTSSCGWGTGNEIHRCDLHLLSLEILY